MLVARGLLLVMLSSSLIVAFLNSPVVAFTGLKNWSRKALYNKIDLCTQSCYSEIIPGLYLSNARAAADKNVLRHLNITHVLTIEAHRLPKSTFEDSNISTLFIRAYDTPQTNLLPYFPMANAFINEGLQKGNVLVHCHFGVSRSATLVIAFIMEKYQLGYDQAYNYVRQRRRFINPNPGFVNQLREYERLSYDVNGLQRLEAYMNVNARKHKYKIASLAAIVVGILVPVAVLVG
ncbi:dual specificity protein phosphatase MPK-4-like [Pectinophora gossypiella]|uniref:dual specificity protein phosphatase MPK-4-like n=1 Tax=Pectinophora gossypiella TaxID=13191 RepID=UPI00214EE8B6|nr:dual specificity protein phosphatase MPK-4-like [Pectinophora gossypiella]